MATSTAQKRRIFTVTMTDTDDNSRLLGEMKRCSGWRIKRTSSPSPGRIAVEVAIPPNAPQHVSWPELRLRGWSLNRVAKKVARKTKTPRRFPRPLPPGTTVFGQPANARLCDGCKMWFASKYLWNPSNRSFKRRCPKCDYFRRPRSAPVATRVSSGRTPPQQKTRDQS